MRDKWSWKARKMNQRTWIPTTLRTLAEKCSSELTHCVWGSMKSAGMSCNVFKYLQEKEKCSWIRQFYGHRPMMTIMRGLDTTLFLTGAVRRGKAHSPRNFHCTDTGYWRDGALKECIITTTNHSFSEGSTIVTDNRLRVVSSSVRGAITCNGKYKNDELFSTKSSSSEETSSWSI